MENPVSKSKLHSVFVRNMICMAFLSIFSDPVPINAQQLISVKDSFCLSVSFKGFPGADFNLWIPEVVIFDSDKERGERIAALKGSWLRKEDGVFHITGSDGTGNKGIEFEFAIKPLPDHSLMLTLDVRNSGTETLTDYAQLAVCLAPVKGNHEFSDPAGSNTFITDPDGEVIPVTSAAEVKDFNHYPVGTRSDPDDPDERSNVFNGFVARTSSDGKTTISFAWEDAARVDVNPGGLDCIHSHPAIGPLKPGEARSVRGIITIKEDNSRGSYSFVKRALSEKP